MIERTINKVIKSISNLPAEYKIALIRILTGIVENIIILDKGKVDKEEGKGLSTNDFTDNLKTKLNNTEFHPDSAVWDVQSKNIIFKHQGTVLPNMTISGANFIKDGMVDNVQIQNNNLIITFNTDAGKQPIPIPLTDIFNPNNYYNKTQIDNKFVEKVAGKQLSTEDFTTEEKTKLTGIENEAQVNKIEKIKVNNVEQEIVNKEINIDIPDVSQFITKSVNDLTNYYLKSDTYTKQEVQALIAAIQQFHYETYSALPASGENNVLYLIGPIGEGSDKYEEYVYTNNIWTKIGDTSINLSGYVTIEALNTALANYQTKLVSGTNIKTINNESILGSGNIDISVTPMTEITWSELKSLRDESKLTPGMQYRITDYQCTTIQTNTQSANHQFDIIVIADGVNKLNENARACLHNGDTYFTNSKLETWQLKYSLDNDTHRFAWADSTNGKGVIYWMKDEWNNECPYDFKNIQFKRKISLSNGYPKLDLTGGIDTWVFTFAATSYHIDNDEWSGLKDGSLEPPYGHESDENTSTFHNNVMKEYIQIDYTKCGLQYLNNNVFFGYWEEIGSTDPENNPFYYAYCCNFNTLGNNCNSNTFRNNCNSNTFGESCYSNTFGNGCYSNTFGESCYSNTFGNNSSSNTFGNGCYSNTFGVNCYSNTLGNNCNSNTLGNNCNSNTFGSKCQYIIFNKNYVRNVIIEDGNQYITLTSTQTTSNSNNLQNFKIAQGVNNTKTVKTISHDTINDAFQTIYKPIGSTEIEV